MKDVHAAKGNRIGQRPPRSKKAEARGNDWNEGFAAVNQQIPEYCVAEDKFAQGYIAGLQRQKRLKKYLNVVYENNSHKDQLQSVIGNGNKNNLIRRILLRRAPSAENGLPEPMIKKVAPAPIDSYSDASVPSRYAALPPKPVSKAESGIVRQQDPAKSDDA